MARTVRRRRVRRAGRRPAPAELISVDDEEGERSMYFGLDPEAGLLWGLGPLSGDEEAELNRRHGYGEGPLEDAAALKEMASSRPAWRVKAVVRMEPKAVERLWAGDAGSTLAKLAAAAGNPRLKALIGRPEDYTHLDGDVGYGGSWYVDGGSLLVIGDRDGGRVIIAEPL